MDDEMKRRLAELKLDVAQVMGIFDARCAVMRSSLFDLSPPMKVNVVMKVLREMLTDEEWGDLQWDVARGKVVKRG